MDDKLENKVQQLQQPRLTVWLTKEQVERSQLVGSLAVIIDVLLTGTTVLTLLELGAKQVTPMCSLDEVKSIQARSDGQETFLTAGEYFGEKPEGFDNGPYPTEFSDVFVRGRNVAYLSTNGCQAISSAIDADGILLGCLRNAPAISLYLNATDNKNVNLICSGSRGRSSLEDFLAASVIVSRLNKTKWRFDDLATLAYEFSKDLNHENIICILKKSRLGNWFVSKGLLADLEFAGAVGASNRIPKMKEGVLVLL